MHRDPTQLYADLLKGCLTRALFEDNDHIVGWNAPLTRRHRIARVVSKALWTQRLQLVRRRPYESDARAGGRDWPERAETMIGLRRLDNLERCIRTVVDERVPGDLLEAGVWRGGAVIFMRAMLEVLGDEDRIVWAADSFKGLPKPDESKYPVDRGDRHHQREELAVDLHTVKRNLRRYGLLDERVRFLPGWFSDTLESAPIERLAIARLDCDMYSSTIEALDALYPRVSDGGFVIVDDYFAVAGCQEAVLDYRRRNAIEDQICDIDGMGVYWRKVIRSVRNTGRGSAQSRVNR